MKREPKTIYENEILTGLLLQSQAEMNTQDQYWFTLC